MTTQGWGEDVNTRSNGLIGCVAFLLIGETLKILTDTYAVEGFYFCLKVKK